jgi:hypothetical protein
MAEPKKAAEYVRTLSLFFAGSCLPMIYQLCRDVTHEDGIKLINCCRYLDLNKINGTLPKWSNLTQLQAM